jgi:hypothetical protein
MNSQEAIQKISTSVKIEQLIDDMSLFDEQIKKYLMQVHPDKCSLPGAKDAFIKINQFRTEYKDGFTYQDDVGTITTNRYWVKIEDHKKTGVLDLSLNNYLTLMNSKEPAAEMMRKMNLPRSMKMQNGILEMELSGRAIPLKDITTMEQKHLNWLFSRLLDFCACLHASGYVHAGLTPESIYVDPQMHGIYVTSFYHMHRLGQPIKSASGLRYQWYPKESTLTGEKIKQGTSIDTEMAKKCLIWAAGDKTGSGTMLRKTLQPTFVDMLMSHDEDSIDLRKRYREWVEKTFERKFVECNM